MLYEIINQSELTTTDLVINFNKTNLIKSLTYYFFKDGVKIGSEWSISGMGAMSNLTIHNLTPYSEYKIYFKNIVPAGYQISPLIVTTTPGIQNAQAYVYAATIYGYKREKNNSDPEARITYMNDAVGKTPAAMDFTNNAFNYGSWKSFCDDIASGVMLSYDGKDMEYLNPDNVTEQISDHTASSVANSSFDGNAMVLFNSRFKWIKRWEDDRYQYVNIANQQIDETYHAYAFTNAKGNVKDSFALGMYHSRTIANSEGVKVSRSISANAKPTVSLKVADALQYAENNGDGWDIMSYQQWQYVRDLLVLITKSDNVEQTNGFGWQNYTSSGSTHVINGADKLGAFYGTKPTTRGYTKTFNLVDFYGNTNNLITGLSFYKGEYKIKNTPPYNIDATNYKNTEIGPQPVNTAATKYWMTDCVIYDDNLLPISNSKTGSATTYFCDQYQTNHALTLPSVCLVGGYYGDSGQSGGIYTTATQLAYNGTTGSGTSTRLSYIDPT